MIVEIKRVKLTASILNQLVFASQEKIFEYEVLGWLIYKGRKRIILVKGGDICFIFMPKECNVKLNSFGKYTLIISYWTERNYISYEYYFILEEDANKLEKQFIKLKNIANEFGQIFY